MGGLPVVLNGGANDLGFSDSKCAAWHPIFDSLIGPDNMTGAIPYFLTGLRATGSQVLWMGYYKGKGKGSFEGCRDDLALLDQRIARFAAQTDGMTYLDFEAVIDPLDPAQFASDNTYPSPKGWGISGKRHFRPRRPFTIAQPRFIAVSHGKARNTQKDKGFDPDWSGGDATADKISAEGAAGFCGCDTGADLAVFGA
jgi:hypothetical protein